MPSDQLNELWGEILFLLNRFEEYLVKNLVDDPTVDWKNYARSVSKVRGLITSFATNASFDEVQMTVGGITGLSRYSGEFFWKPEVEKVVASYIHELALLRVRLLNAYGL